MRTEGILSFPGAGAFFAKYEPASLVPDIHERKRRIHDLNEQGLTPQLVYADKSTGNPNQYLFLYKVLHGHDLLHLPKDVHERSFSNAFAQSVAQVFITLREAGYRHADAHAANYMYENASGRIFTVDDTSIVPFDEDYFPPRTEVGNFANVLLGTYLQQPLLDALFDPEYVKRIASPQTSTAIYKLLEIKGITQKVDPALVEFLCNTFDESNMPENFDAIFALKDN